MLTQFGRSHINTVVQLSVNTVVQLSVITAERLGFARLLEELLTVVYPDTDPPTNKKSEASIFCGKKMMEEGRVS